MNSGRSRHRMKGKRWWQTKVPALHQLACRRGRPRSNSWLHWEITGILRAFPNLATSRRHLSSLLPWCYQGPGPTVALCGSRPRFPSAHVCVTLSVKRPDAISCALDGTGKGKNTQIDIQGETKGDIVCGQCSGFSLMIRLQAHNSHWGQSAGKVGRSVASIFQNTIECWKK